jgi:predicted metal-dependent enzyme (double-stranded beta helix superfamily)
MNRISDHRPLRTALAKAASIGDLQPALVRRLLAAYPDLADQAVAPPVGQPYSRRSLHSDDDLEVMVARWAPESTCAPHDHGGCSGFVVVVGGSLTETDYTWRGDDLVAGAEIPRGSGSSRWFGPEVIHAMRAGSSGGVTLHVYAPLPKRMYVYDVARREVLNLVGDFGAWIPEGDHPRTPFAPVAVAS